MEYRLQSMYNHMVGRAASFVSPFYSILLGSAQSALCQLHSDILIAIIRQLLTPELKTLELDIPLIIPSWELLNDGYRD